VVEIYTDEGISGAKDRDKRPALDAMLNDASRRKFDVVMAWAIDRVSRSLIDLLSTIQHLEASGEGQVGNVPSFIKEHRARKDDKGIGTFCRQGQAFG